MPEDGQGQNIKNLWMLCRNMEEIGLKFRRN